MPLVVDRPRRQFREEALAEQGVAINRHHARDNISHYLIANTHLVEDIAIAGVFGVVRQHCRSGSYEIRLHGARPG